MKTTNILFGILLLMLCVTASSQEVTNKNTASPQGAVNLSCTHDLYELTSVWVEEYNRLIPGIRISLPDAADNTLKLGAGADLSFMSGTSPTMDVNEPNWKIVVGRDIIVPVINAKNIYLSNILRCGVSPEALAAIFSNPGKQNWGTLLGGEQKTPVHIYMVNDASVKTVVVKFLGGIQIPVVGITMGTKDEVLSAIQKDIYAVGFCKVVNILGADNQSLLQDIRLLPVDKNGNGSLDYMENIYSDINVFKRGVWIGKYPKTLYSNIYAVSKTQPINEVESAFLTWVLTDGQRFMNSCGYSDLAGSESQVQLDKINIAFISTSPINASTKTGLIWLILAIGIIIGLVITAVIRRYRNQESVIPDFTNPSPGFSENEINVPNGLYFDKAHTWVFMEKDGNIAIGMDDFLQHITGPITRIEMKNPGEKIKKGDFLFSIIQSGKQLSLFSPVSGTIKKQNEALITNASLINSSPYIEGWVYMIGAANWFQEIQLLNRADKHKKWLSTEFSRIKDFFAATFTPHSLEYTHVVLQDGGALKEGILADFGPEVWEDFQTNFLDYYK